MRSAQEVNFDGLVGQTHTFSGLSSGNLASSKNAMRPSNPRAAALQGLSKMRVLYEHGLVQGVFPPHPRPDVAVLRSLGFSGSRDEVLGSASANDPALLWKVNSASAMWVANAATVSPSSGANDHRVHFTPANLVSHLHRSIETPFTTQILRTVFADSTHFVLHEALPASSEFGDEGAANHTRLSPSHGESGVELFVYGEDGDSTYRPGKFKARQTLLASKAVARNHGVQAVFAQQSPEAIDAGAFHNDVVSVGNSSLLLMHEKAFIDSGVVAAQLRDYVPGLVVVEVPDDLVSLRDAVASYLFNSQLVTLPEGGVGLVAEKRCAEHQGVQTVIDSLLAERHISEVIWVDLSESMRNGGGPACLRLRVELTNEELECVHQGFILDTAKIDLLEEWVVTHYRAELSPSDLGDPQLAREVEAALSALGGILDCADLCRGLVA